MSGDVQPRKRNKDKKLSKKKGSFDPQRRSGSFDEVKQKISWCSFDDDLDFDDTNIHVHKDIKFGGNVVSKVFFSLVFGALICMVGIIVLEHRGTGNEVSSSSESPWSQMLEGWLEDKADSHDDVHHVAHDDHDEEEDDNGEDHDIEEHDDHDEQDDENDHDDNHDDENDHDDNHDESDHSEEQTDIDEEGSYFTSFVSKYIQAREPTERDEEDNDLAEEASVFTGFINKYIYTTEAARDEGYETQDESDANENDKEIDEEDEEQRDDDDENDDAINDDYENDDANNDDENDDADNDDENDDAHNDYENDDANNDDDENDGANNDDDIEHKTKSYRYNHNEKDDENDFLDKNDDDFLEQDDDKEGDDDDLDNEVDSKERVVEDWRKIVYRSPAHEEEEEEDDDDDDDVPYKPHSEDKEDSEQDKEASEEEEEEEQEQDSNDIADRDGSEENEQPDEGDSEVNEGDSEVEENAVNEVAGDEEQESDNTEEDEGAGIAIKFSVGVALIVVAHVVLVKKWKSESDIVPSAPQPPLAQDPPAYIEKIPIEEEPLISVDRRATLVEPGEVVLPPSDVEESDLGEYEEEMSDSELEEELEPRRDSTLVTYEYSPVDTEQEVEEEEEERSEADLSAPINDKWAAVTRPTPQLDSNSENEELTEDEVEYSDNDLDPSPPATPVPQTRYGGPKSGEEDYLLADITNAQDWGIRSELDTAETLYNGSDSSS